MLDPVGVFHFLKIVQMTWNRAKHHIQYAIFQQPDSWIVVNSRDEHGFCYF